MVLLLPAVLEPVVNKATFIIPVMFDSSLRTCLAVVPTTCEMAYSNHEESTSHRTICQYSGNSMHAFAPPNVPSQRFMTRSILRLSLLPFPSCRTSSSAPVVASHASHSFSFHINYVLLCSNGLNIGQGFRPPWMCLQHLSCPQDLKDRRAPF